MVVLLTHVLSQEKTVSHLNSATQLACSFSDEGGVHVLDIIRKKKFGFYESFILFTKLAIFNCDSVFLFVHFHAS